jgi:hypothetical protein
MKVKSKVNTKRLVKGSIYEVTKLYNSNSNQNKYHRSRITIKLNDGVTQTFSINNFKMEDGTDIPKIDYVSEWWKLNYINPYDLRINESNIKEGDFVIYLRNSHRSLITDKKYKVEKVNIKSYKGYAGNSFQEVEIKVEGSTRFYKAYSFRRCTVEETRDTNLKLVFGEDTDLVKVDKSVRKIDIFSEEEKQKILLEILFKSATDKNRNSLSVVDWAISKIGYTYKLNIDDFTEILKKDLNSILTIFK